MIVKKIGYVLLVKLKLAYIIKKLAPIILLIGCLFTFSKINLNQAKQRYQFQEPSLRTKIYEISGQKNINKNQIQKIQFKTIYIGIKMLKLQGLLQNQCIMIVFPSKLQKSSQISWLYESLKQQKILSKNLFFISYDTAANFEQFMQAYYNKQIGYKFDFGIIRQSLTIDIQYSLTVKKDRAFLQIYSQAGVHIDLDFFQALKQLLQSLHIQWSPCQKIHRNSIYKSLKKTFQKGINYVTESLSQNQQNINIFIDSILCQMDKSLFVNSNQFNTSKPHIVMMNKGFQSSFVKFVVSSFQIREPPIQSKKKVSKFLYSFLNEFSAQQDHLHSATTLFYPINNINFIPVTGTLYGGLIILIVGLVKIIGQLIQNHESLELNINKEIFGFIWILSWQYFLTQKITISFFIIILLKPIFSQIKDNIQINQQNKQKSKMQSKRLWNLILAGIQSRKYFNLVLFALYLSIFNFSLFYYSVFLGFVILFLDRKKLIIGVILLFFICFYWKLNSQSDILTKIFNQISFTLQSCLLAFLNISTEVKLISLPFVFWFID